MKITVNGENRTLPEPMHVQNLLRELGLSDRPCAVEVNRQLVPRGKHDAHALAEGDAIEIVTLVGGG